MNLWQRSRAAMDDSITLHDMLNRAHNNTAYEVQLRMQSARTHEQILLQLERALDLAIGLLVQNRKYKQGFEEDALNINIVEMLSMNGIPARHDVKIGGHTDISVEMRDGFMWIAEAKHWRGQTWVFKGFRQLLTRYATGMPGQDTGAVIVYFEQETPAALMSKWKDALKRRTVLTGDIEDVNELRFNSAHPHRGTGRTYCVKHYGVPLFFKPEDG
jgi:hypothetical protein